MAASAEGSFEFAPRMEPRTMSRQSSSESEICEDEILVVAARRGDRHAFGCLYERYARMVHGVLLARVPPGEADDLVQDVFIAALRQLSSLREPAKFGGWVAAIARNRAHDFHRNAERVDPLEDDLAEQPAGSAKADKGDDEGRAAAALAALKSLPETYRETLILRLVEGMTGPEIAARTGLTHGSVRVNLHRGMQLLRQKLNLRQDGDGPKEERA
jgi:RNA polymerase sigma-70 factor, ECF subfamily